MKCCPKGTTKFGVRLGSGITTTFLIVGGIVYLRQGDSTWLDSTYMALVTIVGLGKLCECFILNGVIS